MRKAELTAMNQLCTEMNTVFVKMSLLIVTCLISLIGVSASATEKDALWEKRSNAQIEWQIGLAHLLLEAAPESKELIIVQRDLQINLVRIRNEKYYFLVTNDSQRLDRDHGHLQWANFEWTEADEAKLLMSSDKYQMLQEEHERLTKISTDNLLWPSLRDSFRKLQKTDKYLEIYAQLKNVYDEIDSDLRR